MTSLFRRVLNVCSCAAFLVAAPSRAEEPAASSQPHTMVLQSGTKFAGFRTNGPGVYRLIENTLVTAAQNSRYNTNTADLLALTNRLEPAAVQRLIQRRLSQPQYLTNRNVYTNEEFASYAPGSLNDIIFHEIVSRTNGRSTLLWTERKHPLTWPLAGPVVSWNTNCLVWGMKGLTALSPCWQMEGASGQVPITLLTPRHAYARGHGMGHEGFHSDFNGKKIWFVNTRDQLVEAKVAGAIVRCSAGQDYSILLLSRDVSEGVEPMRVIRWEDAQRHLRWIPRAPSFFFQSEQTGNINAELPGFTVAVFKGGDSGSPDMIPLKNELIFSGGRTTSRASAQMQADMDALCEQVKLDVKRYQLQWVDLSGYPSYN